MLQLVHDLKLFIIEYTLQREIEVLIYYSSSLFFKTAFIVHINVCFLFHVLVSSVMPLSEWDGVDNEYVKGVFH